MTDETIAESTKKQRARNRAERRLIEANRPEFNGYMAEEFAKEGLTWSPRLTGAEKAKAEIRRLAAEHDLYVEISNDEPHI